MFPILFSPMLNEHLVMFSKIKLSDTKSVLYKAKGSKPRTSNKVTMKYLAGLQSIGNLHNQKELKYLIVIYRRL